jgi:hypothetical protein
LKGGFLMILVLVVGAADGHGFGLGEEYTAEEVVP